MLLQSAACGKADELMAGHLRKGDSAPAGERSVLRPVLRKNENQAVDPEGEDLHPAGSTVSATIPISASPMATACTIP